jgi:hypothetical protein
MAVEKVGGGQAHWLAGHHFASYRLGQVGGAPPWPYKYPPTGDDITWEIPLAKLSFLVQ